MEPFVGYRTLELYDRHDGTTFPMVVMYPTDIPGQAERIGPYIMDVSINAAPRSGTFPLVMLSHGSGGTPVLYRSLARHLAAGGFVVGMPEHPFNNRDNNSLAMRYENLENRPRHISVAVERFFDDKFFSAILKPGEFSIVGHSMGGCTALTLAGGVPTSLPRESPDGCSRRIEVARDPRVRSLVLMAPATIWFREPGALEDVRIPILLYCGNRDELTPPEPHARIVMDGVPDRTKVRCRFVENGGHFSFMDPFPAFLTHAGFPPSQDPEGFNRQIFLGELNAEVLDFLKNNS